MNDHPTPTTMILKILKHINWKRYDYLNYVGLTGSYAKNKQNHKSDLDVIVSIDTNHLSRSVYEDLVVSMIYDIQHSLLSKDIIIKIDVFGIENLNYDIFALRRAVSYALDVYGIKPILPQIPSGLERCNYIYYESPYGSCSMPHTPTQTELSCFAFDNACRENNSISQMEDIYEVYNSLTLRTIQKIHKDITKRLRESQPF